MRAGENGGGADHGGHPSGPFDADVVVIGSGFGGAAAALRFAEAGRSVVVLERGARVSRETFQADLDLFWRPESGHYGMNDLRPRGDTVIPWLGAAVGGGSHVFAATLKRRESFAGFPAAIRHDDLAPYYERGEEMLGATPYPDYPPYSENRAAQLLFQVEEEVAQRLPERVESHGAIRLAMSFAPPQGDEGGEPGATFINRHGAEQRYADPMEQKILGGDIGVKNSLDRNYLFLAERLGARIEPLCEADRIEPLPGGGYRVGFRRHEARRPGDSRWRRVRRWMPGAGAQARAHEVSGDGVTARVVVVAAGAVGSTELLLRNREVHRTLPRLSRRLGRAYSSNGDSLNLIVPFRALPVSWLGLILALAAWPLRQGWLAVVGAGLYFGGLATGRPAVEVDLGTTNTDYIRFRHRDGSPQGAYIEGGRYPTPLRALAAALLSAVGLYRPERYEGIVRVGRFLRRFVPPFALLGRSWPLPLLQMGRDDAVGTVRLDAAGRAVIDFPLDDNRAYYADLDRLGKAVARCARAWWLPNLAQRLMGKIEVPHNLGGVPMGDSPEDGVVDHAGRVFGHDGLVVLDGSIVPVALGPNPALTILALAERAVERLVAQWDGEGRIAAPTPPVSSDA